MQFLQALNAQQRQAAEADDGPVLIVAGPGTGKTKTLTARIVYLLEDKKAKPSEIIALTFTHKAAREMRERLESVLGERVGLPKVTTFHAFGAGLLKDSRDSKKLLNEQQRTEIIGRLAKPAAWKNMTVRDLGLFISRTKTDPQGPDDESVRQMLQGYEAALAEQGLYDFDDLLVRSFQLLRVNGSKILNYKYVLVDEFQDTSNLQYEFLKLLGTEENIFAIGDPNQSIYAFRGAGEAMFDRFREDFPKVEEINLTVNYRSVPAIVTLANTIFPNAPQLESYRKEPGSVRLVQTLNEYSEAAYVLGEVEKGIGGSDMLKASGHTDVHEPRDYAVLYRTHRAARALQRAFAEAGVPYQIAGDGSPYERPEIQAIIEIMRYIHSPDEQARQSLLRLPALSRFPPIQLEVLLVKLSERSGVAICDLAAEIATSLSLEKEQNLQQFFGSLVQFGTCEAGLGMALEHIEEISQSEFYDPSVNAVTLLTIHASKGLEFPYVFLVAAEEGILPKLDRNGEGDLQEERRLFYVAVTRAREGLEVLHANFRSNEPSKLSHFIAEIPDDLFPRTADPDMQALKRRAERRRQKRAQTSLF